MKIAIPTEHQRLHGHFGGSHEFTFLEVDSATRTVLRSEILPAPDHQPGAFPLWLREKGVEVVIVGGIGRRALNIFENHGITVRAGVPNTSVEDLTTAYLNGQLLRAPDGCEHHDHHDHEHGHHHHHGHQHHHGEDKA